MLAPHGTGRWLTLLTKMGTQGRFFVMHISAAFDSDIRAKFRSQDGDGISILCSAYLFACVTGESNGSIWVLSVP